jgi:transposase
MNPTDDRLYAATLRAVAIAQVRDGRSIQEVADALHIPMEALADWLRSLGEGSSGGERTSYNFDTPEQKELQRLRLENDYLRQQRDLYRKACGIVFVDALEEDGRKY